MPRPSHAGLSGSQKPLAGTRQRCRCSVFHGHGPSLSERALLSGSHRRLLGGPAPGLHLQSLGQWAVTARPQDQAALLEADPTLRRRFALDLPRPAVARSGAKDDACLLAFVGGWIAEGIDTPDLKNAKALLDALARPIRVNGGVDVYCVGRSRL